VFGVIFRTRLAGNESSLAFVIWLISGYGPWLAISEALTNATHSVVGQSGIVKNMAFKTELLPFASTAVAVVPLVVSFAVLLVLLALDGRGPNAAWLIIPYVLVMQFALVTGIGLVLAASNVFLRDIGQLLPNALTLVLFLSPIFYQVSAFPEIVRPIAEWNPFYLVTAGYREPILNGTIPSFTQLAVLTMVAGGMLTVGLWYFRRLKTYFSGRI
jgi:lipopolysaccharide transport system permease protein